MQSLRERINNGLFRSSEGERGPYEPLLENESNTISRVRPSSHEDLEPIEEGK